MAVVGHDYDLVVIGTGPAGEKAAVQAAYFNKRVAIVEKEPEPGGAAVHTGTLPSKTLRETALFLSGYRSAELYGLSVSLDRSHAVPRLLSRKDAVRGQESKRIRWNLERHRVSYLEGRARFVDAHTLELTGRDGGEPRRVTTEFVLVCTGSVPFKPDHVPFEDPDVDDSDTILELDRLPKDMVVVGGGVIGCEYTSMFAALGVQVTLIEPRHELLSFLDAEVSEALRRALVKHGVDVRLDTKVRETKRGPGGIHTSIEGAGTIVTEKLLFAAGRSGATRGLGLEGIGVKLGRRDYVEVDGSYRTSVPNVFAAGDVVGFPALASTSMEQGRVAVCRMFGFPYKQQLSDLLPYGVYTIPEVSCVGLSEEDAAARGIDVVAGKALYEHNARAKIIGDHEGLVKLVFERDSRKLIGAHVIGDRATELVHVGQAMITLGGTVDTIVEMVFNYPTLSECYKYAAYDALGNWSSQD